MSVPAFARSTRSSTLKTSPRAERTGDVPNSDRQQSPVPSLGSPKTGRKLKRPSTLTKRARESIAYNADLYHIRPANRTKSCPLMAIPSELRTLIYSYVFGDLGRPIMMNYGRKTHPPSALLQICRAVRIESAYIYFAEAAFTWIVKNLNFSKIMKWLDCLQPSHRSLLSRNPNLVIEIVPGLFKMFTYPPKGFLLDDTMENHWKACQPFGNLYMVKSIPTSGLPRPALALDDYDRDSTRDNAKILFILFCRLAAWSRKRTHPSCANIRWRYTFDLPSDSHGKLSMCYSLSKYQLDVQSFLTRLKHSWTRNPCENRIREPILQLFDAFLETFAKLVGPDGISFYEKPLFESLRACRSSIENWSR